MLLKQYQQLSNGDMRKAIMLLQNLNYLNKKIDINDVFMNGKYCTNG